MSVKLKNYTTSVPAGRTISEIQELLIEFGAEKVMLDAQNKQVVGISFAFFVGDKLLPFKLPANIEKVHEFIWHDYYDKASRPRKTKEDFLDAAYNIAWRIIKDWIHAQLSIIKIGMVRPEEVFLPYLWDGDRTLAQKFNDVEFKKLLPEFKE